jgi:hypothetical protein
MISLVRLGVIAIDKFGEKNMRKQGIGILVLLTVAFLGGVATAADATATAKVAEKIEISATTNANLGTLNVGTQGTGDGTVTISSNTKWDLFVKGGDAAPNEGKLKATYGGSTVYTTNPMNVQVDSTERTLTGTAQKIVDNAEHGKDIIKTATYKQTFDYLDPVPDSSGSYTIVVTWTAQKHV